MKNDERIKQDVQDYIFTTDLPYLVSGVIKKDRRPRDSRKEDVIIAVLANENGQIQDATVNVNVYVADRPTGNQYDPNHERLDELADVCQRIFEVFRGESFRARLLSQRITAIEENEHVITNKIEFKQNNEII